MNEEEEGENGEGGGFEEKGGGLEEDGGGMKEEEDVGGMEEGGGWEEGDTGGKEVLLLGKVGELEGDDWREAGAGRDEGGGRMKNKEEPNNYDKKKKEY